MGETFLIHCLWLLGIYEWLLAGDWALLAVCRLLLKGAVHLLTDEICLLTDVYWLLKITGCLLAGVMHVLRG
jgi:hypothetical protein